VAPDLGSQTRPKIVGYAPPELLPAALLGCNRNSLISHLRIPCSSQKIRCSKKGNSLFPALGNLPATHWNPSD
jgi:hypothetical protein